MDKLTHMKIPSDPLIPGYEKLSHVGNLCIRYLTLMDRGGHSLVWVIGCFDKEAPRRQFENQNGRSELYELAWRFLFSDLRSTVAQARVFLRAGYHRILGHNHRTSIVHQARFFLVLLAMAITLIQCKNTNNIAPIGISDGKDRIQKMGILPGNSSLEISFSKPIRIICKKNANAINIIPTTDSTFCMIRLVDTLGLKSQYVADSPEMSLLDIVIGPQMVIKEPMNPKTAE